VVNVLPAARWAFISRQAKGVPSHTPVTGGYSVPFPIILEEPDSPLNSFRFLRLTHRARRLGLYDFAMGPSYTELAGVLGEVVSNSMSAASASFESLLRLFQN